MKSLCNCGRFCANPSVGVFILRVVTGIIFLYNGIYKLQNMALITPYFETYHVIQPLILAVSILEVVGGIALIWGIWTCLFSTLLVFDMIGAILLVKIHLGLVGTQFEFLLLASLIALKYSGGGKWKLMKGCGCIGAGNKTGTDMCEHCGHDTHTTCGCDCHPKASR